MKVTLDDIARMANVSKATVSRVINQSKSGVGEKTRAHVQRVIEELEYKPNLLARGISVSKTKTIGVIVPDITNPFFSELTSMLEAEASRHGYTILLCVTSGSEEKERKCISVLITKHVDGVVLVSQMPDRVQEHFQFQKYQIPCVLIDRKLRQAEGSGGVFVDNEYAFFSATEFLIRSGSRRILFISGPQEVATSRERVEGYRYALKAHGLEIEEKLIASGEYCIQTGYDTVYRLHSEQVTFTAVLAANDTIAIGAVKALKELGKHIPDEIEVIGFDNIEMGELIDPPLTTIEQPIGELGKKAIGMLLSLIQRKPLSEQNIRLESRLIQRKTTRPASFSESPSPTII